MKNKYPYKVWVMCDEDYRCCEVFDADYGNTREEVLNRFRLETGVSAHGAQLRRSRVPAKEIPSDASLEKYVAFESVG